ncbi:diacylglycerol O-acyltransferase 1-like [Limulus polyphemus]|uniref:O-acyltransferase n=1 Tax=Limulus polyphemus TaxID=6850 RepID=A0ABM1TGD6_LIMPO|nr:diacylglycerol O-acyltransferase 1-like [Limulus polyphemus]
MHWPNQETGVEMDENVISSHDDSPDKEERAENNYLRIHEETLEIEVSIFISSTIMVFTGRGCDAGESSKNKTRLRRTQSVTRVQDVNEREKRERAVQPDNPVHRPKDSLLSFSSGYTNYRGLLNLCIILLVLSNTRVALENIIKYGILVDPLQWFKVFMGKPANWPSVLIVLSLNVFILFTFFIEILYSKGKLHEMCGRLMIVISLSILIIFPVIMVFTTNSNPIGASVALGSVSITFLKLVSYHMVNFWCRESRNQPDTSRHKRRSSFGLTVSTTGGGLNGLPLVRYPQNLNIRDIYYFMCAPTLCYELNFPRSAGIRKRFLLKRIVEMIFLLQLILGLVQQWIVPIIRNTLQPLKEMNLSLMLERLLKLAVPNHMIWLLFFYWFFHSCSNAVAEILRFADREFYRDWWNAETVNYFWKNWNVPVHRWAVRHLYRPLTNRGFSKNQASMAVFFVSAFFHEYLVSIPLNMYRIWAFSGMLGQVPFAMFVSRYLHNQYGNMAVWISIIIGQPLCILMYYHDYYIIHYGSLEVIS